MEALKLQAYLDGELTAQEAQEVAVLLERDAQAHALHTELKETKAAMAGNELEVKVPETREFYFSRISREIERQEQAAARSKAALPWWRRLAVPLGIAVAVAAVALPVALNYTSKTTLAVQPADSPDASTFAFYNEEGNVTVVWVNSNQTANGN